MKRKFSVIMLSAMLAATMFTGCGDSVETGRNAGISDSMKIAETKDESNTEKESMVGDSETETERSSQEERDKEPEIVQTLDLDTCGNLVSLMKATAASVYGNSLRSVGSVVINATDAQEWINQLYQGSWENIGDILCDLYGMDSQNDHASNIPYINEILNQPEVIEIIKQLYYDSGWIFNKEQMEHLAYSITGSTWEMQDMDSILGANASNALIEAERFEDKVAVCFFADGDNNKLSLENMALERIDSVNWKVTADGFASGIWLSSTKIAEFTFTVTYNADSCFDGYSITGIEVTPIDNSGWALAYLDQMDKAEQQETLKYDLIYLDADDIPELVLGRDSWISMYTWRNGRIYALTDSGYGWSYNTWGNFGYSYVPYTGIITYDGSYYGEIYYVFYEKLNSDREWQKILEYKTYMFVDANGNDQWDEGEETMYESGDYTRYVWDPASDSYRQITAEEPDTAYDDLGLSGKEWIYIEGRLNSYDMRYVLEGFIR